MRTLPLTSPASDGCRAAAAAAFEARLGVVAVHGASVVCRLEAQAAALRAWLACGGFCSGGVLEFGPGGGGGGGGGVVDVVGPVMLVLGWPRGNVTLRDGDLIWNRDAAMVLTARA